MWIVMFSDEYAGAFVDEGSKVFDTKEKAECYANQLNKEIADEWDTKVEDLGDYYTPIFVEKG